MIVETVKKRHPKNKQKTGKKNFYRILIILGIACMFYIYYVSRDFILDNLNCYDDYENAYEHDNGDSVITVIPIEGSSELNRTICAIGSSIGFIFLLLSCLYYSGFMIRLREGNKQTTPFIRIKQNDYGGSGVEILSDLAFVASGIVYIVVIIVSVLFKVF
jgi:hypothetical protein